MTPAEKKAWSFEAAKLQIQTLDDPMAGTAPGPLLRARAALPPPDLTAAARARAPAADPGPDAGAAAAPVGGPEPMDVDAPEPPSGGPQPTEVDPYDSLVPGAVDAPHPAPRPTPKAKSPSAAGAPPREVSPDATSPERPPGEEPESKNEVQPPTKGKESSSSSSNTSESSDESDSEDEQGTEDEEEPEGGPDSGKNSTGSAEVRATSPTVPHALSCLPRSHPTPRGAPPPHQPTTAAIEEFKPARITTYPMTENLLGVF